ncbi:MAG: hypothetical protein ACIAS6_08645 [Phycisphaerales bacterium JB060]
MGLTGQFILAQASQQNDTGQFLAWVGALIVVVVLGTLALLFIRRRMVGQASDDPGGFSTMEEMRAMVARGEMSKDEYEQVRKAMIAKIKDQSAATPPATKREGGVFQGSPQDRETGSTPD